MEAGDLEGNGTEGNPKQRVWSMVEGKKSSGMKKQIGAVEYFGVATFVYAG